MKVAQKWWFYFDPLIFSRNVYERQKWTHKSWINVSKSSLLSRIRNNLLAFPVYHHLTTITSIIQEIKIYQVCPTFLSGKNVRTISHCLQCKHSVQTTMSNPHAQTHLASLCMHVNIVTAAWISSVEPKCRLKGFIAK